MKVDASRFRPRARQAHGFEKELMKALCLVFLTFIMMFPMLTGEANIAALDSIGTPDDSKGLAVGGPENLMHVTLPPSVYRVEPGRTMDLTGFAYVDTGDDRVLFLDPLSGTSFNMSVGPSIGVYNTLIAADVDDDGHDQYPHCRRCG
jgi:hypothetical protein